MTHKVWYRNNGQIEVDVIADRGGALRRAASMTGDAVGSHLEFIGVEDDDGNVIPRREFDQLAKGLRLRGLVDSELVCPKYHVEVRAPELLPRSSDQSEDEVWVTYAIELTRIGADKKSIE